ncbi:transcription termination factor 2 isoform X2 [Frankliniella occidentalis]|nr:transcription termination factor 2 isoform X2 [Frankliniella occidentalis]XP_052125676.1 transcription termination factor 2 isoform X2 [Frankliniella occidentalis]
MDSSIEDSPVVSNNKFKPKKTLNFDTSDESVNENDAVSDSDDGTRNISTDLVIPASDNEESELESSELRNSRSFNSRNSESGDSNIDPESGDAEVDGSELGDAEEGDSESGDDEVGESESGGDEVGDSESGDDEVGDSESEDTEAVDSDQADMKPSSPNSSSGESIVGQSPVLASFKPAKSSNLLRKSLTRKNLGGQATEQNESSESLYLSFQESPLKRESIHHSSPIGNSHSKNVHNSHSNTDRSLLNAFSANNSSAELPQYTDNSQNNISAEVSEKNHDSSQPVNNSRVNVFADARDTPGSVTPDDHHTNSASGASLIEDDNNIESTQSENEDVTQLPSPDRPRTNVIDLTQSDSSLQNSPVGATRQFVNQRDIAVIVGELSAVNNDVMVKQTLLDTIDINTLPDKGRNLMNKVAELQKRKSELEDELHSNEEYSRQKKGLEQMQNKIPVSATKQTTLNFQNLKSKLNDAVRSLDYETKNIKPEPNQDYRSFNSVDDDFSPESKPSLAPSWGDLPKPDMTISGFGKKAMQTHLAEKALTLEALSSLHQALKSCPTEETVAEDPRNLKVELLPHQKHGLAWMLWREQERPSGGILADDMGLGKTISMISLILKSQEMKEESENDSNDTDSDSDSSPQWMSKKYSRMPKGGTLVVCPASLMNQWEREILKRVKRRALSVELYHGPKRETKPRRLANYDVIITTYNLVSRESGIESAKNATVKRDQGPLFLIKWNRIILDEAHMVRNHKSQMALGVCELTGKHRWCLTGTPIQNKELDLYALLKFLRCSPFDDLTVWKRWVDNKNAAGMQRLNTMMKSLMLRRTKEQLHAKGDLDCLPAKFYERIDIHLDPEELVIYEKVAIFSSTLFAQFLSQRAEKQQALDVRYGISSKPAWEQQEGPDNQFVTTEELAKMHRKFKGIQDIKTHQILVLLLRLRQICNHPGLVKKMVEDGDLDMGTAEGVEDNNGLDVDLFNQMNKLNISESNIEDVEKEDLNKSVELSVDNPVLDFQRPSAKIRAILDLVQEKIADTDDKAIIVSQWTSMLNIISPFLKDLKIKFDSLTGEVPVDKRQEIVNEFNKPHSGPQILLLSLTAGGVGLNLIGANHLILVDIHWNPQLENQACDRIYRVGQKKDVNIYRLITINTIEERIKSLQDYKLSIADSVLTGTRNTQTSKLTLDDLKMLFSVPAPSQPLPDEQHLPPAH